MSRMAVLSSAKRSHKSYYYLGGWTRRGGQDGYKAGYILALGGRGEEKKGGGGRSSTKYTGVQRAIITFRVQQ